MQRIVIRLKMVGLTIFGLVLASFMLAACNSATATTTPTTSSNQTTLSATTSTPASAPTLTTTSAPIRTTAPATSVPAQTTQVATTNTSGSANLTAEQQAAEAVVRRFVEAANRGDVAGVANSFAPNARFDSIGRIYQGRDQIMSRFLQPEVLAIGGRYEILSVVHAADAVTFEFNFRAGSLFEHFTYKCIVRDNFIQDIIGRYIQTQPTPTATTSATVEIDPASQCYVDAVNNKKLDALVACFAPDGVVIDVSRQISGQAAIRTWAQNEVIGGSLRVIRNEASTNRNRLLVHWAPAGSNGWQAWHTIDFKDGKITRADLQYA